MIKKNKNQKGILLLELILALSILSLFLAAILFLISRYEKKIRLNSVASQMSKIFSSSEEYIKNNYDEVHNNVLINNYDVISLSDLVNNGYLTDGYDFSSLYNSNIRTIAIMGDHNLQLFTLHPCTDSLSLGNVVEISSNIAHGYGGVYYTNSTPSSPCSGASCMRGYRGSWFIDSIPTGFNQGFAGYLPNSGEAAIVLHKKLGYDGSPYLNRKKVWGNLAANSMSTDLNLKNVDSSGNEQSVNILFNAFDDGDEIENKEIQLLYTPNNPSTSTPTLSLLGDATPDDSDKNTAMLVSNGGIGTDLVIEDITTSCNQNGLLAVDEDDNFLQCVNSVWFPLNRSSFVVSSSSATNASAYLVTRNEVPIIILADDLLASDTILGYFE